MTQPFNMQPQALVAKFNQAALFGRYSEVQALCDPNIKVTIFENDLEKVEITGANALVEKICEIYKDIIGVNSETYGYQSNDTGLIVQVRHDVTIAGPVQKFIISRQEWTTTISSKDKPVLSSLNLQLEIRVIEADNCVMM
ncbi:MAG: hypothetical protein S4CHLAM37_06910 [Chlamydiia bacterium]|nr:hypothetical protein [Chlamydiia bacterium]